MALMICPACEADAVYRSHTRSWFEHLGRAWLRIRAFECHSCGARFRRWQPNLPTMADPYAPEVPRFVRWIGMALALALGVLLLVAGLSSVGPLEKKPTPAHSPATNK